MLVSDQLAGRGSGSSRSAGFPGGLSDEIEAALEPTGASLVAVGVIREPPDLEALADDLSSRPASPTSRPTPKRSQALGTGFGRQLVIGGNLLDKVGSQIFSRVSGSFGDLDGLVVVREPAQRPDDAEEESVSRLESAACSTG